LKNYSINTSQSLPNPNPRLFEGDPEILANPKKSVILKCRANPKTISANAKTISVNAKTISVIAKIISVIAKTISAIAKIISAIAKTISAIAKTISVNAKTISVNAKTISANATTISVIDWLRGRECLGPVPQLFGADSKVWATRQKSQGATGWSD
jgi:hypothetical protein